MFEAILVSAVTLAVLLGAPVLAHLVGWAVARSLRVRPGAIREWMPSIPDHIESDGRAEARWEKRRKALEGKLLQRFSRGVQGAEAHALAGELGEDPEVVAGALGRMREEIPTRLRVTKSGKLLHDFDAESISALKRRRVMALPARLGIFVLGVFANLGAAWPVLMGLLVALGALAAIAVEGSAVAIGGAALAVVTGLFIVNMFAGWLTHLVLTPGLGLTSRPRLGPTQGTEASFAGLQAEQAAGWSMMGSGTGSSSSDDDEGGSWSGLSGCDADLGEGAAALIVVVLLLAVVAACTAALVVFVRGIWRAATGAGLPPLDVSPTQWIRSSQPNDSWERFIPTNDLVLRVMRVLKRLVSHTHPRDSTIVGRVMARAKNQGGRIAAFEIALQEGLDVDEATALGARLSGRAGGRIDVTDDGELDFVFPAESLSDAPAVWDDDLHAEYIDYLHDSGTLVRRKQQVNTHLPVNLPGIAWSHVKSASRLAAGTVLMMLTGVALVSFAPGIPVLVKVAVDSFLPLLAIGTFALAGVLRYVVSTLASIGVRRDIRRAAFLHISRAMKRGRAVRFDGLTANLLEQLKPAWSGMTGELVEAEVRGVLVDLDLEPVVQTAEGGEDVFAYEVGELQDRLDRLRVHREALAEVDFDFGPTEADDDVVFDSQVEHDRVRALG
jgi:hypothetical protein